MITDNTGDTGGKKDPKQDQSLKVQVNVSGLGKEEKTNKVTHAKNCLCFSEGCIDLIKWLIGTVGLTVLSTCINNKYQTTQQQINRNNDSIGLLIKGIEADSKLIDVVSKKYDPNRDDKKKYYEFIRPFVTTEKIAGYIDKELAKYADSASVIADNSDKKSFSLDIDTNIKKQLIKTPVKKDTVLNITHLKKKYDELFNQIDKPQQQQIRAIIKSDSIAISRIKSKDLDAPAIADNYELFKKFEMRWFKEGYFLEFDDIRVSLIEGNARKILISVATTKDELISSSSSIELGTFITLDWKDNRYLISYDYYGAAGKNPFTKAAYITVSAYKKQEQKILKQ